MFTKRLIAERLFCSRLVYFGLSSVVCCFSVQDQNIILQENKRTINLKNIKVVITLLSVSAVDRCALVSATPQRDRYKRQILFCHCVVRKL